MRFIHEWFANELSVVSLPFANIDGTRRKRQSSKFHYGLKNARPIRTYQSAV